MTSPVSAAAASVALFLVAGLAQATAAPAQLLNKTVRISASATVNAVAPDGSRTSVPRTVTRTLYISSKGRVFSRSERRAGKNADTVDQAPGAGGDSGFRFDGNRLIGVTLSASGARQVTITFDPSFSSCTATIAFGREGGKPYKVKGLDGKMYTATGVPTASSATCSVQAGNPFAQ
jgi:hypothetical protein